MLVCLYALRGFTRPSYISRGGGGEGGGGGSGGTSPLYGGRVVLTHLKLRMPHCGELSKGFERSRCRRAQRGSAILQPSASCTCLQIGLSDASSPSKSSGRHALALGIEGLRERKQREAEHTTETEGKRTNIGAEQVIMLLSILFRKLSSQYNGKRHAAWCDNMMT